MFNLPPYPVSAAPAPPSLPVPLPVTIDRTIESSVLLEAATTAGPGPAMTLTTKDKVFQIAITGVATVGIEVSNDARTWETLSAPLTRSGTLENAIPWRFVRANVLNRTSGEVTVTLGSGG